MTDDPLRRAYHTDPREYDSDGSISPGRRMGLIETTVKDHETRINSLEGWRDELRGVSLVVRFVLGLNLIGIGIQLYVALVH